LYEDSENNLWIGTWKGLDLFDRQHNKFIHYNLGINEELYITNDSA
ncbi:MAG: hypothetical protein KAR17_07175, partial [Cyclobacteriaceae bacterium]|nr:hypothetical protein [Cyclobacteriaceae bacterium]